MQAVLDTATAYNYLQSSRMLLPPPSKPKPTAVKPTDSLQRIIFFRMGRIHRDTIPYASLVVQMFEKLFFYHCGDDDEKRLMVYLWPELLQHLCYKRSKLNHMVPPHPFILINLL